MIILKITDLDKVVELLRKGKEIIFPTETSYGLGCDATNQFAVDTIFKIKERPIAKSLLIIVLNAETAKKYLVWNEMLEKISQKYWPGPLTVIGSYKKNPFWQFWKKNLARGVVGTDNSVAVRVTDYPLMSELSARLGCPIVATSANVSGNGDFYNSQEVIGQFSDQKFSPDALIDGGALPLRSPTTIVSVIDNKLKVLRQGECIVEI
ncbi:MAG: threonylcarbamoyl-AMP synthase [Candidatus Magasanikbacteria bacterium CG10_big_fil_rev_8_21_14_0_10_36_32]|uniref:L-threonylcarbamoyladenylate synthase n=1 Tax=Candidatus Magasanikbacteria bacterium CG10_big_fil_rev_8_21_14_0_10_36_32 TaxID=1974646 RepID=A0A2M6W7E7_9BACT|nr:MAG: threonylcarbamoyl-AMP synthase [Candidatus Magasanikbacteria bacterium CG10_big_fil_rev_8_21_14_0_10_36_32]